MFLWQMYADKFQTTGGGKEYYGPWKLCILTQSYTGPKVNDNHMLETLIIY